MITIQNEFDHISIYIGEELSGYSGVTVFDDDTCNISLCGGTSLKNRGKTLIMGCFKTVHWRIYITDDDIIDRIKSLGKDKWASAVMNEAILAMTKSGQIESLLMMSITLATKIGITKGKNLKVQELKNALSINTDYYDC